MASSTHLDESSPYVAHDDPAPSTGASDTVDVARVVPVTESLEARINAFADAEYQRVVAAVSLWCGSYDDAVDAVTDTVGRAWERLERGQAIDNLAAWVTTVAMNQVRARHRRRNQVRRKGHLIAHPGSSPGPGMSEPDRIDLQRALSNLGERQRQVVALRYGLDLTIDEVAAQLDIAPGTVKATLHKSRRRLATALGIEGAEGSTS